jgi:hypothetical protein
LVCRLSLLDSLLQRKDELAAELNMLVQQSAGAQLKASTTASWWLR